MSDVDAGQKETHDVEEFEAFNLIFDDSEKDRYQLSLPLDYDYEVVPEGGNGKAVPVSSIRISDTSTIISVPDGTEKWKLSALTRKIKASKAGEQKETEAQNKNPSNKDGKGTAVPEQDDESGDGQKIKFAIDFIEQLITRGKTNLDEKEKNLAVMLQGTRREIIIQRTKIPGT